MATNYTPAQERAIETLDKSVLVAAAAGSGKTTILVQRILNIIEKGEADVDELLIVTFTNAAAAEMRVRLSKQIKKRIQEVEDPKEKKRLAEQLDKLYRAYISTFNSFAMRIIKEFFYEVNIEPNFKVCDEVMGSMLQYQAVDQLFEDCFEKDNMIPYSGFREFLRLYSNDRSEKQIKEEIISSYQKLRTLPDYFIWAHNRARLLDVSLSNEPGALSLSDEFIDSILHMLKEVISEARLVKQIFASADLDAVYEKSLQSELDQLEGVIKAMQEDGTTIGEVARLMGEVKFGTFPGSNKQFKMLTDETRDNIKQLRDAYKKKYTDWAKRYLDPSLEQRVEEMRESYRYTEYFLFLLEEFEKRYDALKRAEGLMDFADMDHIAVRILKKDEIADSLRARFRYIFVDEYQDTNNIQEALIDRIARADNVFKVGDVKQSIYRFRQAEPEIFQRIYREYKKPENDYAEAIDLNTNFRTNKRTLAYINKIFEDAMEGYDEAAKLHHNENDGVPDEYDFIPEVHLLVNMKEASEEVDDEDLAEAEKEETKNSSTRELSAVEAEAKYVAELVSEIIGTEFYDRGRIRKAEAKDIAILLRGTKYVGDVYAKALRGIEIQAHIEEEEDYFDSIEIKVAIAMLMTIDNFKRDIPLISTLHSESFGYSVEELGRIRAEHKEYIRENEPERRRGIPYWQAVKWYVLNGADESLQKKLAATIETLEQWREFSTMMPINDFIWKVLTESGYYMFAGAMYGGSRRQANLRMLADRASVFTENRIASLGDYIEYLEVMRTKKMKSGQLSLVSKDDNVIRISTIHKSKGLEYPFVIVAGIGKQHISDKNTKGFKFDTKIGVGLPYVSPDKTYWRATIQQQLIHEKIRQDESSEELRVLYVALTRAKNKLYLVGTVKDGDIDKLRAGVYKRDGYLKSIGRNIQSPFNKLVVNDLVTEGQWDNQSRAKDVIKACSETMEGASATVIEEYERTLTEVKRRLGYRYPGDRLNVKAKYSVSEIRRETVAELEMSENGASDDEVVAIVNNSNMRKKRASSSDIGIAYHRIVEYVDFGRVIQGDVVDVEYIKQCALELKKRGAIDEAAFDAVDLDRIVRFFESELGRRAVQASQRGSLRKEKAFTLAHDRKGEKVLVQGVIDCCFEEDGEMVLIDYKSSFVKRGLGRDKDIARIKRDYAPQIEIYSEALAAGTSRQVKEAYLYLFLSDEAIKMEQTGSGEEDESEDARRWLRKICSDIGLDGEAKLEDGNLDGDTGRSRLLIDNLSRTLDNPAPDDEIWSELSKQVQMAFPRGFVKASEVDEALARQVHQLRYIISAQQVDYVRAKFPRASDEDSLAAYFATLEGRWSAEESDRLHNKCEIEQDGRLARLVSIGGRSGRGTPGVNIKLVCGGFHSEFILDSEGNFVYLLNPKATLNDIVNCSSFNYAEGNDLWLDGEENPLSIHGILDVHISALDPPFRRRRLKGFISPTLIEYRLKGRGASKQRKMEFARKVNKE